MSHKDFYKSIKKMINENTLTQESNIDFLEKLVDDAYDTYSPGMSKSAFWDSLPIVQLYAVAVANVNNQVENGGWSQWITNGYSDISNWVNLEDIYLELGTPEGKKAANIISRVMTIVDETEGDESVIYSDENTVEELNHYDELYYEINDKLMVQFSDWFERNFKKKMNENESAEKKIVIHHKNGKTLLEVPGNTLVGADLRRANLEGAFLVDADLRDAYLYRTNLRGADLRGADLRGANLRGADIRGANVEGADLRGANLEGTTLEK